MLTSPQLEKVKKLSIIPQGRKQSKGLSPRLKKIDQDQAFVQLGVKRFKMNITNGLNIAGQGANLSPRIESIKMIKATETSQSKAGTLSKHTDRSSVKRSRNSMPH